VALRALFVVAAGMMKSSEAYAAVVTGGVSRVVLADAEPLKEIVYALRDLLLRFTWKLMAILLVE